MYIIVHKDDPLLVWRHNMGWIPDDPEEEQRPTVYRDEDIAWMKLPIDGEWCEL